MADNKKVMDSIKNFLLKMKALDEAIPEELAQDALEMTEEVKDALCDESPNPLEITKDKEADDKDVDGEKKEISDECIESKVEDAFVKVMKKYGLIKDEAMESLENLDIEDESSEEKVTVDPEKMNDSAKRELLRKVKPMVASIKDSKQRKAFADAFAEALILSSVKNNQYGDILNMVKANAKDSMEKVNIKTADADYNFGMDIAKKFNPHYKEVK